MNDDIYTTPKAELDERPLDQDAHYVVSISKLTILFYTTFAMYLVYWFYAHWQRHKIHRSADIWPIPRAIFSVFFTHSLFRYIDEKAGDRSGQWPAQLLATVLVVAMIAGAFVDSVFDFQVETTLYVAALLLLMFLQIIPMARAQAVANENCNDSEGASNNRLTIYNWLWIVAGIVFWLFFLLGVFGSKFLNQ